MRSPRLWWLIATTVALGCRHPEPAGSAEPRPQGPVVVIERSGPLPPLARALLSPRMHRDADTLASLHAAVLSVDHDAAGAAARAILAEPRLSRPAPGLGPTLNDEVPAAFYDLQDRLVTATRRLQAAAAAHDDDGLSAAYGELTSACVGCHATYLRIPAPGS